MTDGDDTLSDQTALLSLAFDTSTVTTLRHEVTRLALAAGLHDDRLDDFVIAVNELVINAVAHGGGRGHLHLDRVGANLICRVTDQGGPAHLTPPDQVPTPTAVGGRGLWLADHLADSATFASHPGGLTATITMATAGPWPADRP
ncbi:ATP-binding protein [Micromonospora sp. SH-82]|uniref:ATP-binding protein n=1 Tax=Micromonospora sp. SH-82 TaxID=3132938 RepID=UPI003EB9F6C7